MKTLSFDVGPEEKLNFPVAIDALHICVGPDGEPRIAAHGSKTVYLARRRGVNWQMFMVAKAATDGDPQSMAVVDVYRPRVASSTTGDAVVVRNRTKGMGDDRLHGPSLTFVPANGTPRPIKFMGFTEGAAEVFYGDPAKPNAATLWAKDGIWQTVDVLSNSVIASGNDRIGRTGEKLVCTTNGEWRGFSGCASQGNSAIARLGGKPIEVMDCDIYTGSGSDTNYPGMAVRKPKNPVVYFFLALGGKLLVQKVCQGVALFAPGKLPSIGPANTLDRHAPQGVLACGRIAAIRTVGSEIWADDVDAALAGSPKTSVLCDGNLAAACPAGKGKIALAVAQKGGVYFSTVTVRKE